MSEQNSESQPPTPQVFMLSNLFKSERIKTKAPISNTDFLAIGLDVESVSEEVISNIFTELMNKFVRQSSFEIAPGNTGVYIDKRILFDDICEKIDSIIHINSPQEFFLSISIALEILSRFENSGPKVGSLELTDLQAMLKDLLSKQNSAESIFDPNT